MSSFFLDGHYMMKGTMEYGGKTLKAQLGKSGDKLFTPASMDRFANKIHEYAKNQNTEIQQDIKQFDARLKSTQKEIDNIVDAVAQGMFHTSFKERMDKLEDLKAEVSRSLNEAKLQADINSPTVEMIKKYIVKDADMKNRSPEEQKRIIQAYVQKVTVYEDRVDINMIVDFIGAPCGTRPPDQLIRSQRLYPAELRAHKHGDPSAIRTRDTLIKSQVLCRLS